MTLEQFHDIYRQVPRLCVEILISTPAGILLTRRGIEPCRGQWHLPGGTVYFGESLTDAVRRVARLELAVDVEVGAHLGYIEYPAMHAAGYCGWPVGLVFEARMREGEPTVSTQTEQIGYFTDLPEDMISDQHRFLCGRAGVTHPTSGRSQAAPGAEAGAASPG